MKIVFFGTPEFADIILARMLTSNYSPDFVICNSDRPVGRKKIITSPLTKQRIENLKNITQKKIVVWQPEKLNSKEWKSKIGEFDLGVVAAYAKIIPREILDFAKFGVIGVHPSLLPMYRGTSPIQSVILSGEKETGVTLYLVDEKVDHGPILSSVKYQVLSQDDYMSLEKKLAEMGAELLIQILAKFSDGELKPEKQDEAKATFTQKFKSEDAFIDYNDFLEAEAGDLGLAMAIDRKIRAFIKEPGAWTIRDGKRVKLLEAEIIGVNLRLKKIQIEGEKPKIVN